MKREIDIVIGELLKVVQDHYDLVESNIWDRIPLNGKRQDLWKRTYDLVAELTDLKETEAIRKLKRTGPALAEDIVPIEYELEDIKKELQRMYVLIHKLQYPPNNDIKIEFK